MTDAATGVTAAVLAGGLGTRLRAAVDDRPKVLAPVGGRPFLCRLLDLLDAAGLRRAVLLTGHRAGQVREALGDHHGGMALAYSEEPAPRGTGGALREALPFIGDPTILLLNGDSYCDVDVAAFVAFHRRRRADLSLSLTHVDDAGRYGRVETADDGGVTAFSEKRPGGGPGWVNAGVYLIERRPLEMVPTGQAASLERDLLPRWLRTHAVYARPQPGPFFDIGTPESYAAAAAFFERLGQVS